MKTEFQRYESIFAKMRPLTANEKDGPKRKKHKVHKRGKTDSDKKKGKK